MRSDCRALSPVVAVMLLLLITVVLASAVYLISSDLAGNINTRPFVALSISKLNTTSAEIRVAEVSQSNLDLASFRSVLMIDGLPAHSNDVTPLASGTYGDVSFFSMDSLLNAGDAFTVQIIAGHTYSLLVLWSDGGSQVGATNWHT